MIDHTLREDFVSLCHRLHSRNLIAGLDGNVSLRLGDGSLLVTPSGCNKGFISPDMLLRVDENGALLEGGGAVTSEIGLHTGIMRGRPDVNAVIHTHAPFCTAFAILGQPLPENLLTEIPGSTGRTAVAPYAPPGTPAVSAGVEPLLAGYNAILLQNHGIVVMGKTLLAAYSLLEALENAAQSIVFAKMLGTPVEIV